MLTIHLLTIALWSLKIDFPESSEPMFIGYKLFPSLVSSVTPAEANAIETFYGPDSYAVPILIRVRDVDNQMSITHPREG